jgi:hypothetical protein
VAGSDASEVLHAGGGRNRVATAGGEDTFVFYDSPGKRDVLKNLDSDLLTAELDLGGAIIDRTFDYEDPTALLFEGADHDGLGLVGVSPHTIDLI